MIGNKLGSIVIDGFVFLGFLTLFWNYSKSKKKK